MTLNEALEEEITSINAIYNPSTVEIVTDNAGDTVTILSLPNTSFSFRISFPGTYPDLPPQIHGIASVAEHRKGEGKAAAELLRNIIARVWVSGQVCLFDLIEEARSQLEELGEDTHGSTNDDPDAQKAVEEKFVTAKPGSTASNDIVIDPSAALLPSGVNPPSWILSDPLSVNKSTFLAHCVPCDNKSLASTYITHLLSTNKKVATATHNISAWRLKEPDTGVVVQDSDDDGETAAGGRLLHLMQLMDAWNVVVVVTRWYGGVKLGPERFRCINGVAKEALVKGRFCKEENTGKKGKK